MRNLLSTLLVFSFLFTIGCEDDDASAGTLVGVWNMTSIVVVDDWNTETTDASSDYSIVIIFNEDSTFSKQEVDEGYSYSQTGTWSTSGNKLTIITEDVEVEEGTYTTIWDYTLSGSSLSMTYTLTDEGYTYTTILNFTKG